MLLEQSNIILDFKKAIADIGAYSKDTNEHVDEAVEEITNGIDYMRKLTEKRFPTGGRN